MKRIRLRWVTRLVVRIERCGICGCIYERAPVRSSTNDADNVYYGEQRIILQTRDPTMHSYTMIPNLDPAWHSFLP